ncbi:recombination protein RecR [Paraphotobacterium marinum]|uniref:Recombination protein RecR n=1 Tax=Paraphotobacterium marinum TaxID=1755811 RepID=A0A220VDP7_9GAMM|nr:recombination mediator RecR [Paraphotobacterium marinum]ASK78524.1 recombination protein RecR [Paraphotobacterium marinum]
MKNSKLIETAIEALTCLPGVGPKSAQRMIYSLLKNNRHGGINLSQVLKQAMTEVSNCSVCQTYTENEICEICLNKDRLATGTVCVVENPSDIIAVERTGQFDGRYFVLHGNLSPIDGISPEDLKIDILENQLKSGNISEVILATSSTIHGEATALFISEICKKYKIQSTRIAYGIPIGGELDLVDGSTLIHAFSGRKTY